MEFCRFCDFFSSPDDDTRDWRDGHVISHVVYVAFSSAAAGAAWAPAAAASWTVGVSCGRAAGLSPFM